MADEELTKYLSRFPGMPNEEIARLAPTSGAAAWEQYYRVRPGERPRSGPLAQFGPYPDQMNKKALSPDYIPPSFTEPTLEGVASRAQPYVVPGSSPRAEFMPGKPANTMALSGPLSSRWAGQLPTLAGVSAEAPAIESRPPSAGEIEEQPDRVVSIISNGVETRQFAPGTRGSTPQQTMQDEPPRELVPVSLVREQPSMMQQAFPSMTAPTLEQAAARFQPSGSRAEFMPGVQANMMALPERPTESIRQLPGQVFSQEARSGYLPEMQLRAQQALSPAGVPLPTLGGAIENTPLTPDIGPFGRSRAQASEAVRRADLQELAAGAPTINQRDLEGVLADMRPALRMRPIPAAQAPTMRQAMQPPAAAQAPTAAQAPARTPQQTRFEEGLKKILPSLPETIRGQVASDLMVTGEALVPSGRFNEFDTLFRRSSDGTISSYKVGQVMRGSPQQLLEQQKLFAKVQETLAAAAQKNALAEQARRKPVTTSKERVLASREAELNQLDRLIASSEFMKKSAKERQAAINRRIYVEQMIATSKTPTAIEEATRQQMQGQGQ